MIYPVTGWFEITQYDEKIAILTKKLVETTWLIICFYNANNVWPRTRTYRSWVQKTPNLDIIQNNWLTKHFGKSYFQCNIGTDLQGSGKHRSYFYHYRKLCWQRLPMVGNYFCRRIHNYPNKKYVQRLYTVTISIWPLYYSHNKT